MRLHDYDRDCLEGTPEIKKNKNKNNQSKLKVRRILREKAKDGFHWRNQYEYMPIEVLDEKVSESEESSNSHSSEEDEDYVSDEDGGDKYKPRESVGNQMMNDSSDESEDDDSDFDAESAGSDDIAWSSMASPRLRLV